MSNIQPKSTLHPAPKTAKAIIREAKAKDPASPDAAELLEGAGYRFSAAIDTESPLKRKATFEMNLGDTAWGSGRLTPKMPFQG